MSTAWLLSSSVKAAILLAASGLGAVLLRRSTAAARHQIWALGVIAALVVPLLSLVVPSLLSVGTPTLGAARSLHANAVVISGESPAGPQMPWSWLALVWASGSLVVLLQLVRGQLAARRIARASEPAHAESWLLARREAATALGITAEVGLRRSAKIGSPMTIGVLRPWVLLPAAADSWPAERLQTVLVHELGHVQRHDLLLQLGAQIACALYWWNPLTWLAAARLRSEREHACDDLVLGAGVRPSSYAADLLEVSRSISRDTVPHACACIADASRMEVRLRRILDVAAPRAPLGVGFRFAARGATLACVAMIACTSASAELPASSAVAAAVVPAADVAIGKPSVRDPEARPFQQPGLLPEDASYLAVVAIEVQRHAEDLKRCFEGRRRVHPALSGEVVIHWTITTDGKVPDQCITRDTVGDPEIADCVNKLVTDSKFPAPPGAAVSVEFPFVFRTGG